MFYIKLNESRNYINNSIYSLFYAKLEVSFILEKSGPAKTGPAGPVTMPLNDKELSYDEAVEHKWFLLATTSWHYPW